MTGLMYYRPEDHLSYLQECLKRVHEAGVDNIRWQHFVDQRRKTPLPPIPSEGDGRHVRTPTTGTRDNSFITGSS